MQRNKPVIRRTFHTFSVKEQLLAKYGPRGYGRVLEQLRKIAGDK